MYNGSQTADITVFEFNDNDEPISKHSGKFRGGNSRSYTADSKATVVKVYVEEWLRMGWIRTPFWLSSGPTEIVIDDNTQLGARP